MADRLPNDLLRFIGYKLDSPGDRIRFRAVAKSWMFALPFRQPPRLLLFSDSVDSGDAVPRGFFIAGEETIAKIDLPEIHNALVVGSCGGWLITAHEFVDEAIRMVNPFSRLQIQFPSQLPNAFSGLRKIVLSSCPHNASEGACVAMVFDSYPSAPAIARLGDASWTSVQVAELLTIEDVIFYKQQFYAICNLGNLMVCNLDQLPKLSSLSTGIARQRYSAEWSGEVSHYLVEWLGELLVVVRFIYRKDSEENTFVAGVDTYTTIKFKIYKFNFVNGKFDDLSSLGDYSLFLGINTSVAVLASHYFGLVRKNCIYFTNDYKFGSSKLENGVFDLEDSSIAPLFEDISMYQPPPPVWIIPS